MRTSYERATAMAFRRECERDPKALPVIAEVAMRMSGNVYPPGWVDVFIQKSQGVRSYTLEEAYAFAKVDSMCRLGQVATVGIVVGEGPGPDRDEAGNNAILARLPEPFSARCFSGIADDDGMLEWSAPIVADLHRFAEGGEHLKERITLPPGSAPLEIGTTTAARSLVHLGQETALARWPYDSEVITLLVMPREEWERWRSRR